MRLLRFLAAALVFAPLSAFAAPVITNVPLSAMPGNVVTVVGQNFDGASTATITPLATGTPVSVPVKLSGTHAVSFEIAAAQAFDIYTVQITTASVQSNTYKVNLPLVSSFDQPDIAPGMTFRAFGRNLYVPGDAETMAVALVDQTTLVSTPVAVNASASDQYSLSMTVPAGIVAGHAYALTVTKGSYVATSPAALLGHASGGSDYLGLGVAWGLDFKGGTAGQRGPSVARSGPAAGVALNINSFDCTADPRLTSHCIGDGVTDNSGALQAAINAAAAMGGGLVYLPPGKYLLSAPANGSILMKSGVAVQGAGQGLTTILYGPTSNQGGGYVWYGFNFIGVTLSGFADLTLTNQDTLSQSVSSFVAYSHSSKLFLQRVTWNIGTGNWLTTGGTAGETTDRLLIANSTITGAINNQNPITTAPNGANCTGLNISGGPVIWLNNLTNLWVHDNKVYGFSGDFYLNNANGVIEENNVFTRDAGDKVAVTSANLNCLNQDSYENPVTIGQIVQRQISHLTTFNDVAAAVFQNNTYQVVDGALTRNMVDGETLLGEDPFGKNADSGTVASVSGLNLVVNAQTWNVPAAQTYLPGEMVAIVTGTGWGQMRNVTGWNSGTNTFTIDRAWDIAPAAGDVVAVFMPVWQDVLIRNNTAAGNPAGILMFNGAAARTSVLNNQMTNNGCVLFQIAQTSHVDGSGAKLGYLNGIEINQNVCVNANGLYPSYIAVDDAITSPATIEGTGAVNVDIRNNSIYAYNGTIPQYYWKDGSIYVSMQNDSIGYTAPGIFAPSIIGTVLQANVCNNCTNQLSVSGTVYDTVAWNSENSAGAFITPSVSDTAFGGVTSVSTITGHD